MGQALFTDRAPRTHSGLCRALQEHMTNPYKFDGVGLGQVIAALEGGGLEIAIDNIYQYLDEEFIVQ